VPHFPGPFKITASVSDVPLGSSPYSFDAKPGKMKHPAILSSLDLSPHNSAQVTMKKGSDTIPAKLKALPNGLSMISFNPKGKRGKYDVTLASPDGKPIRTSKAMIAPRNPTFSFFFLFYSFVFQQHAILPSPLQSGKEKMNQHA